MNAGIIGDSIGWKDGIRFDVFQQFIWGCTGRVSKLT